MAFPSDIPTRMVTAGGAMSIENSNVLLKIQLLLVSSKSLVWDATGYRFEKTGIAPISEVGTEVEVSLPRTDVAGWKDAQTGALIDVSAPDSYTHRYTATLRFLDSENRVVGNEYTYGPFTLPAGDGPVDVDKLIVVASTPGGQVAIPDSWTVMVNAAIASLPGQVDKAIGDSEVVRAVVVDAAADAVTEDIAGRDLVEGNDVRIYQEQHNEVVFLSVTDSSGRRSWLEIGEDGAPTSNSVAMMAASLGTAITSRVVAAISTYPLPLATPDSAATVFSIVDAESKRSWLEIDEKGGPTANSLALIQAGLVIPSATPALYKSMSSDVARSIVSGPDFYHLGDSLTASNRIAAKLAALTGRTHRNGGVGGETSYGIAARANALPYLMVPVGGEIPASGAVDVTFTTPFGVASWPLLQGSGGGSTGVWAGVAGTFSFRTKLPHPDTGATNVHVDGDIYQFTRTAPGVAVPVRMPQPFMWDFGAARRNDIVVMGMGQNGPNDDGTFASITAVVNNMTALYKRYLIWTATGPANTGVTPLETRVLSAHGRRFVNARRYLIDYALADMGLTPTADDLTDIAAGIVPRQLRTDSVHHTQAAQEAMGEFLFYPRLVELGDLS